MTARMLRKMFAITTSAMAILAGVGCGVSAGTSRAGPYSPVSEGDRDEAKAARLTKQAAELIDTKPDEAEKLLREALNADLYHGPAHNNLGVVYLAQGKLYEAAGEFEWARKVMPGHPDPRMNLAFTLELAGRTDDAISTYASALEVYPDHLPTMQALARLQLRAGKTDERTRHFLDEIVMRGESPEWQEWARAQLARPSGTTPQLTR
ncbi:MAG: tetratricopeptide repeat protein [Phycisphaerales bacterium]|nr:tetratricopeptide repeat protein [Phycisphaerales bacterium]